MGIAASSGRIRTLTKNERRDPAFQTGERFGKSGCGARWMDQYTVVHLQKPHHTDAWLCFNQIRSAGRYESIKTHLPGL